jgi:FkbM family methyltransferase
MSLESKLRGFRQILRFDNRLHLVLQRLFFRRDRLGVYRMGPLEFVVDHAAGDASGAPEVLTRPIYADYLAYLRPPHPATVLDIGANAGGFPLFLVKHGIPLARVVSVELNPRTCIRLRFNLERNVHADLEVVNAALCGDARTFELALGDGSVADSVYAPSFNASATTTTVPGRTFDDLCAGAFGDRPVDICKIDVERAEYEVFANPGHERLRQCRVVVIEIHDVPGRQHRDVTKAIERLGFRVLPQQSDRSVYVFVNDATGASRTGLA